ncbi:unnamed protein product [Rhizoctonia solani]|uniref:Concentrative nucleoside transporter N-terminal domain-containing protein n=1 Tax=Rhizoctonia solani TaxID=456999 RepID=A0A8H3DSW8_9AGAM|nr:unnamed protein product [Rhizoctonia solani]
MNVSLPQVEKEKRSSVVDEKRDPGLESGSTDHESELDKRRVAGHDDEAKRKRRLKATRHRGIVQTFWAWTFILIIAFRLIPDSVVTRPVSAVWQPIISRPFFSLSYRMHLAIGWVALLGIVFGSAFGFAPPKGTSYGDRAISVFGLFVFTTGFWFSSKHRSQVPWPTVIAGLFMQQIVALFMLKTDAGFELFLWIPRLAADVLDRRISGPSRSRSRILL